MWWPFIWIFISSGIPEDNLFSLFFLLDHISGHAMQFREIDHSFSIGKMWDMPLPPFLIPLGIIDDGIELIVVHQDIDDGLKLFDLFFLVTYGIKQLFFLFLVLILYIFELD